MDERVSQDDIRELSNKLDAFMGLVITMMKRYGALSTSWAVEYLLEFGLSDKSITAITGAKEGEMRKAKSKAKTSKVKRNWSWWDKFKES